MKTQSVINNKYFSNQKDQNARANQYFTGAEGVLNLATKGLEMCDKYPMVGVSFTDTVATNIPRTVVDLKTGVPAAMETFRREFSGLFVNCLMPSFIVLGGAKLLNKPILGKEFSHLKMSSSWANGENLDKLSEIFKGVLNPHAKKVTKEEISSYVKNTLCSLEGLDGSNWVKYSEKLVGKKGEQVVDMLSDAILNSSKDKKALKSTLQKASEIISNETHATQTLRFKNSEKIFGSNLSELLRDQVDLGKVFKDDAVRNNLEGFTKAAKRLVNTKSIAGLAVILPIAMSMQYINRALTRKKYNKKGAPIYKDFEKGETYKEMSNGQKSKFFMQKLFAAGSMVSLALLSMMKRPSMSMFQFKGMFPTVDQCRWIATGTFVSRIFASEDPNELRESTVRDMASFAGLYFLGDYAGKLAATVIEKVKPDVKLLNRLSVSKPDDSIIKKAGNWIRRTSLKSFNEVLSNAKNMRSVCQIASLGFSIISLGIILPAYNRKVTEKKVAREKAREQRLEVLKNTGGSKLIIELQNDKFLSKDGVFHIVAQDCFK